MVLTRELCTHMFYFLKLSSSDQIFFITLFIIYFMLFHCSQTEAFIQRPQSIHSIQSCRRILSGTCTHSVGATDAHAWGRCILVPDSHVRQIPSRILQRTTGKIWTFICAYTDLSTVVPSNLRPVVPCGERRETQIYNLPSIDWSCTL